MIKNGFIKIPRALFSSDYLMSKPYNRITAFMWLVMSAYITDTEITVKGEKLQIERGSFFTTKPYLADVFGWSNKWAVGRFLDELQEINYISYSVIPRKGILIKINNFNVFNGLYDDDAPI